MSLPTPSILWSFHPVTLWSKRSTTLHWEVIVLKSVEVTEKKQTTFGQETSICLKAFLFSWLYNYIRWSSKNLTSFCRFCFAPILWISVLWQHDICPQGGYLCELEAQGTRTKTDSAEEFVSYRECPWSECVPADETTGSWLDRAPLGSQMHSGFSSLSTPLSLSLFPPPFNTITGLLTVCACFKGMSVSVCAAFPAGPTHLSWKELRTVSILWSWIAQWFSWKPFCPIDSMSNKSLAQMVSTLFC